MMVNLMDKLQILRKISQTAVFIKFILSGSYVLMLIGLMDKFMLSGFAGKNFIIIFLAVIVLTLIFGRVYCGWLCPWGFLFELSYILRVKLFKLKKLPELPENIHNKLIYLKYIVLFLFIIITVFQLNLYALLGLSKNAMALVVLTVFTIISFFNPRAFCKYFCPVGALLSILSIKPLFKLKLNNNCVRCKLCERKCPMQIKLTNDVNQKECVRCFECKSACKKDAIDFKI
ncbi:4Fe-4S ferredoxin iron-sulfur binding domain-containing protein [Methanothermococcus okinawensis IH1]|uniref:4Fe-4S ferredoxin iron-sulfur binding domain-containing protein n=2 Tax=Methanothermococcus okinawensis TaxID=155863 RepID=F8ALQ5_METOI|nr:4Fe-4S ferredoxin iron-sulfur binding domain-containing protein [Methanothermococcus okinawensis IH1]